MWNVRARMSCSYSILSSKEKQGWCLASSCGFDSDFLHWDEDILSLRLISTDMETASSFFSPAKTLRSPNKTKMNHSSDSWNGLISHGKWRQMSDHPAPAMQPMKMKPMLHRRANENSFLIDFKQVPSSPWACWCGRTHRLHLGERRKSSLHRNLQGRENIFLSSK